MQAEALAEEETVPGGQREHWDVAGRAGIAGMPAVALLVFVAGLPGTAGMAGVAAVLFTKHPARHVANESHVRGGS